MPVTSLRFFAQFLAWVSVLTLRSLSVQLPILTEHSFLEFTAASCDRKVCVACGSVQKKKPRRESTEQVNQGFNQIRKDHLRKRFRKVREDEKIGVCLHSDTQGVVKETAEAVTSHSLAYRGQDHAVFVS